MKDYCLENLMRAVIVFISINMAEMYTFKYSKFTINKHLKLVWNYKNSRERKSTGTAGTSKH